MGSVKDTMLKISGMRGPRVASRGGQVGGNPFSPKISQRKSVVAYHSQRSKAYDVQVIVTQPTKCRFLSNTVKRATILKGPMKRGPPHHMRPRRRQRQASSRNAWDVVIKTIGSQYNPNNTRDEPKTPTDAAQAKYRKQLLAAGLEAGTLRADETNMDPNTGAYLGHKNRMRFSRLDGMEGVSLSLGGVFGGFGPRWRRELVNKVVFSNLKELTLEQEATGDKKLFSDASETIGKLSNKSDDNDT